MQTVLNQVSAMGSNNECYVESLEITNNIFFLSLSSKKKCNICIYDVVYNILFVYLYVHIYIHMYVGTFVLSSDFVYLCTLFYFILFRHFCADHHNLLVMVFSGLSVCPSIRSSVSGLDFDLLTCVFETCFSGTISADLLIFLFSFCLLVVLWLWTCCDHSVSLLVFFSSFFF